MESTTALEQLRRLGPVFRSAQAVSAGVSWRDLYALRDAGAIIELSRGLFQVADEDLATVDFVAVCGRVPHGMICWDSSLEYWDLTDEIPRTVHVAVPTGSHRPTIDYPPTQVHVFAADTFDLGREEIIGEAGERFWISDRERTVVDVFRLRHLAWADLAYAALRQYLRSRPRLARLAQVAQTLRARGPLSETLQVLQAFADRRATRSTTAGRVYLDLRKGPVPRGDGPTSCWCRATAIPPVAPPSPGLVLDPRSSCR